ncbi:hypothetical protein GCM10010912_04190 [Paenibacillus albidus]|uniref:YARHG domain-containing protein n=1 Tax=Paenibacillus albidus TaxID=2041023 RepID=A0A917BZY4_9BACL|nr:YARHG domain-containing protein [Paenibacillus albidus]GGF62215.1 hypothetical protein GCM10010912_04190 [Paenibacillus albidus]
MERRCKLGLVLGIAAWSLLVAGCSAIEDTSSIDRSEPQKVQKELVRDYIFKDSDTTLLTEANVSNLDGRLLELARNEIFARHGLVFKRKDLQSFFEAKSWYKPDPNYGGSLTVQEKKNIALIQKVEQLSAHNRLEQIWEEDYHVLEYPSDMDHYKRKDAWVDLDGDGTAEQIQMSVHEISEDDIEWQLTVNQQHISGSMRYPTEYFQIVDADINDSYFEIAIENYGEDAARWTEYYYYNGHSIVPMGEIDGITGNKEAMNGKGGVNASIQAYTLQSWYYLEEFHLDKDHLWQRTPKAFYAMEPPTPWIAKVRVPLYKSPGSKDIVKWVEPGEKVFFLGGDPEKTGKLRTEEGSTGWIWVQEGLLSGTSQDINDCFDGRLLYG